MSNKVAQLYMLCTELRFKFLSKIEYMPLLYGVHRLSGVVTTANAAYSASELEYQLKTSKAKALVTVCCSERDYNEPVTNYIVCTAPRYRSRGSQTGRNSHQQDIHLGNGERFLR